MYRQPIHSKSQFLRHYSNLLEDLEHDISELSAFARKRTDEKTREVIGGINRLKLYHKNLRDLYEEVAQTSDRDWQLQQAKAQELVDEIEHKVAEFSHEIHRPMRSTHFSKKTHGMKNQSKWMLGIGGAALGGVLAWLFGTESGRQVRQQTQQSLAKGGIKAAAKTVKKELSEAASNVQDTVTEAAEGVAQKVQGNFQKGREQAKANVRHTEKKIETDLPNGGF